MNENEIKQDEIIRMAREAGISSVWAEASTRQLERFVALVAEPWIETTKALAKEIIELKKQVELSEHGLEEVETPQVEQRIPSHVHIIKQMEIIPEQDQVHVENIYKRGNKYFAWIGGDYVQIYTAPVSIEAAVLAEREACAKVCDAVLGENNVSAAIRARGEK